MLRLSTSQTKTRTRQTCRTFKMHFFIWLRRHRLEKQVTVVIVFNDAVSTCRVGSCAGIVTDESGTLADWWLADRKPTELPFHPPQIP